MPAALVSHAIHHEKVSAIAAQLQSLAHNQERLHIDKGGVHHFVPLPHDRRFRGRPVDVSGLNQVLDLDVAAGICTAEPGVTFTQLLQATLPHGLAPAVVPELEGITIGGAIAGCSIESMSFRTGGLHDSCLVYEIVTGAGEILTCSPAQEPLIFDMIHGSYGTLGILTSITFKLVPARPTVHLEYRRYVDADDFHEDVLERCAAGDYDFIDGIIHGPHDLVLCLGRFADHAPYTSNYRRLDIYYKSTLRRKEDYLTTPDYYFRYDTECHWLSRTLPPLEWKPVRLVLGKFALGSTNLIRWSNRLSPLLGMKRRPDVVVDVFIPSTRWLEFFRWYERDFAYYPLWIVPYRVPQAFYPWIADELQARMPDGLFMDCAVYGRPNNDPVVDYSQLLEEKTFELGGIKTLISRNHYTRERFWQNYNRPNYERVKQRLDPHGVFPWLDEKFAQVT